MSEFLAEINWSPLWISLKTGFTATVIAFFLGIFFARLVMKMKPVSRGILDGILTMPLVLPPTVAGFILLLLFSLRRPFGAFLLDNFDIKIVQTWKGCVIAASVIAFPLMYRNARAAFEQVDVNLIAAGKTLGMSDRRIFWTVPMSQLNFNKWRIQMRKIMIVDDNYLSAEGIEKNIDWEVLNAEIVHICYNGTSAIDAMKKEPVDLIISDIEMPDLDGISMSRQALDINPMVKIILISAYDKFEYARRALLLGALDYIEKPLDYAYLIQKVKNAFALMEREQKNLQLLKQSRPLLIEKFFRDITHRSRQETSYRLKPYLNYLNLKLDYDFYNVVILELENAQSLRDSYGIEKFQMELLNLRDLITEQTSELNYIYPLQDIDGYLCVIGQSGCQSGNFRQLTYKIISALVDNCNSQGLVLNAGIGAIVQDLWDLNRSYESAVHALDYRFFFPHQNVFDGREALGHDLSATDFSDSREEELIRLLCKKDVSAIDSWFQDFSRWLTENFRTKSFAFIQIYSLLGRILKFFYELNLDTHDLEAKILYVYNHLEEFHTTEELCGWLNELCRLLCRKLDSSLNDYHQKLCESVTSYIDENYASNTLCLNDIASEANVSPAYLSALFKKKQGVSISDYITTQRINAACRYLTATNMTLKEISMKCGYANQYYFSTSFKKKMNVTPSAYRDTQTSKS